MIALALPLALGCVGVAMLLTLWRLVRGPSLADRIVALDTMVVDAIALIVLIGMTSGTDSGFEAALLLAMVGFVGTVAYCKFILRGDIVE
ncbi:K+/H+ antiporter subunit F [Sphingomonas abaci]|uniref:Multicomponent K+:H+ antiporter subunit F n=1 Tax=Sphingomonas abaci TaxID=237611 RepID=A0A7W7AI07_9SPHN|nr:K+/H+ antiporter subunit F [Sphingomonas abaci]MBB4617216.1 multicomponent K+:H+ antiporter subunit F [Sphingomonas abaci]